MNNQQMFERGQNRFLAGLVVLILWFPSLPSFSQENSVHSVTYGIGYGISDGDQVIGGGGILAMGYQYAFGQGRLRLNPALSLGAFNANFVTDVRDQWVNSVSLELILWYDLLRIRAFSLTLGAGAVLNNTRGLLGTGGYPPGEPYSEYISLWQYGGYLGAGIRIHPASSRIAVFLRPVNFHIGPGEFLEGYAMIGMDLIIK